MRRLDLIGEGEVAHTATFDELLSTGTPVIPDKGEETDPAVLMYTGAPPGCPRACCMTSGPRS
jgi:hypothetical protein